MTEWYSLEECLRFVSRYLDVAKKRDLRGSRDQKENDHSSYRGKHLLLSHDEFVKAHQWFVFNSDSIKCYIEQEMLYVRRDLSIYEHF